MSVDVYEPQNESSWKVSGKQLSGYLYPHFSLVLYILVLLYSNSFVFIDID